LIVRIDAIKIGLNQLAAGQSFVCECLMNAGDGRFFDLEGLRGVDRANRERRDGKTRDALPSSHV
jgi:hypothetical protein